MLIRSPSPILPPRLPDEEAGKRKRRKTLGFPRLDRHEKKATEEEKPRLSSLHVRPVHKRVLFLDFRKKNLFRSYA